MSPSSVASPGTALLALRAATRGRHVLLDALIGADALAQPEHRARTLQRLAAVLPAWERAIRERMPAELRAWFAGRTRLPWLFEDLAALRVASPPALASVPLADEAEAWGAAYVLEGAALGGQVIARSVRAADADPRGIDYFHGFGAATGAMWREFCARLEAHLPTPALRERACAAACRLFDDLTTAMAAAQGAQHGSCRRVPLPERAAQRTLP